MPENLNDWLGLVVPEGTTNYVTNPSFEPDDLTYGLQRWLFTGCTNIRSALAGYIGGFGARMTATNVANSMMSNSAYPPPVITPITGPTDWTVSAGIRATQPVALSIINMVSFTLLATVIHPGDGKRRRISATALGVGTSVQLGVHTQNLAPSAWQSYDVDAIQLEPKAYMTTYCDGDQPECRWLGRAHASGSMRPDYARSGGRFRTFRELGINVRSILGAGAPPMSLNSEPYAILPGADYQKTTPQPRVMTLNCQAIGSSRDNMHDLRQLLLSVLSRYGKSVQPIWLRYQRDDNAATQIGVHYEGGMEMGEATKFMEPFPLRLIAFDPYWQADHDLSTTLTLQDVYTPSGPGLMIRKSFEDSDTPSDWGWTYLGNQAGDNVTLIRVIEVAPDGIIYVAGTFSQIGGVAANNIAYYDGKWNAMGTGVAADSVRAICFGEDGQVYFGGSFTTIGGTAATRFARYNPNLPGAFQVAQNFTSGTVYSLKLHPNNGRIYIAGSMVRSTFTGLDCYDPATNAPGNIDWGTTASITTFQATGGSAQITAMCFFNNELYLAGNWTSIVWAVSGGARPTYSIANIAKFKPNQITVLSNALVDISSNLNLGVSTELNDMLPSADGRYVYLAGKVATVTGSIISSCVVGWNGSSWVNIGAVYLSGWAGVSHAGTNLRNGPDGALWVCGRISSISSANSFAYPSDHIQLAVGGPAPVPQNTPPAMWVQSAARWNGVDWAPIDMAPYYTPAGSTGDHQYILSIAFTKNGDMLAGAGRPMNGMLRPGTLAQQGRPIVVDAPTPVRVFIIRTGSFMSRISNLSSGDELYFKNPSMSTFGRVFVDTNIGQQKVVLAETKNGIPYLSADTSLATFWLQPGENKITAFAPSHGTTVTPTGTSAAIWFRERLLSIDATPRDDI